RGMERNGITGETCERIVQAITSFALYGFPESHAASFALIAYASAYLKCHYLAAFTAALLNNQPMGFYQPATLIKDAQRHGLTIEPIDITRSNWACSLEGGIDEYEMAAVQNISSAHESRTPYSTVMKIPIPAMSITEAISRASAPSMRLGFRYVKGLREEAAQAIVCQRLKRPFCNIDDLHNRVPELRKDELRKLAEVGA